MTDPLPSELEEHPTQAQLQRLEEVLRTMDSVLVCFSGGIDSAFLLAVAHRTLGSRAIGLTAVSPSLPSSERHDAERIARELGARHETVLTSELSRPGYRNNGPDRCFHCKSELYDVARAKMSELGLSFVVNGTNLDDLGDYRPGLDAARAANVRAPLVEVQMTKADVRRAARHIGLRVWDKPAAACLSSRLPYGTAVTVERLAQIEGFEADLHELGFRQVRVRWHDSVARIEVPLADVPRLTAPELTMRLVELGRSHGFRYVTVDLGGYRQGSLNDALAPSVRAGRALPIVSS